MTEQDQPFEVDVDTQTWTVKLTEGAPPIALLLNGHKASTNMLDHLEERGLLSKEEILPSTSSRELLEAILIETIGNSVEATGSFSIEHEEAGYNPEIQFRTSIEGDYLWVNLVDNGTGFSQEMLDKVGSEPIDSAKRSLPEGSHFGGVGRHLYNTKLAIEPLGWKLEIKNREDQHGAVVSFGIPVKKSD